MFQGIQDLGFSFELSVTLFRYLDCHMRVFLERVDPMVAALAQESIEIVNVHAGYYYIRLLLFLKDNMAI